MYNLFARIAEKYMQLSQLHNSILEVRKINPYIVVISLLGGMFATAKVLETVRGQPRRPNGDYDHNRMTKLKRLLLVVGVVPSVLVIRSLLGSV